MKKTFIFIFFTFILFLVLEYIFIPNTIKISATTHIKATISGIHRILLDKKRLETSWIGKIINDSLYFNDFIYTINENNVTVLPVSIKNNNTNLSTTLFLTSLDTDSTQLQWTGEMQTSYNPYNRLISYIKAKKINENMETILQKFKYSFSQQKNIYGLEIKTELVVDSFLITTSAFSKCYPKNEFIYTLIEKLKKYIALNNEKESGYPMLNISNFDSSNFEVKVAIPTKNLLKSSGVFFQKRMLGRGKILSTVVIGDNEVAKNAFEQVLKYSDDYQRSSPAIPFYSLITNRILELDSNKWTTKIYLPVM